MMMLSHDVRIWLCAGYTDMRKGFDGLAAMVQHVLQKNHSVAMCLSFVGDAATG